jgi:hypothetical protein
MYIQYPLQYEKSSKNILLIESFDRIDSPPNWQQLLDNIQRYKPKQIIFTSWPQQATKEFYQSATTYQNVIFGRELRIDAEGEHTSHLEPLPAAISEPPPPY